LTWRLELTAAAQRELDRAPSSERTKILFKLWELKENPRLHGSKKLAGTAYWRVRQGNWRMIYAIDAGAGLVIVARVARRNERTYDGLH
jgi:mRNA interferase RelE/StbE